ncbi:MAG: ftsH3, partial [Herbinix sp.]|nr:ftsH3 [Herbinix sp.]
MKRILLIALAGILLLGVIIIGNKYFIKEPIDMTYRSFIEEVEQEQVQEVIFSQDGNTFEAVFKDKSGKYIVTNPKTDDFTEYLLVNDITVSYGEENSALTALKVVLLLGFAGGMVIFLRNGGNAKELIKDSNRKKKIQSAPTITLAQVAGNIEAKSMVEDIISFIKEPDKYADVGARMPKGLLLYGPPGTGKTLMAKAIAGEANVPFYAMSGSDFVQMYVGVGASRIRSLFNKAKKNEKAVIFIDEIDAIGKKRARNTSASNDERDQTLNALLTEMSGFHENQGIIVIGATNRLDTLDEALLRPGRFDRHIEIGLPDVNARKNIL